MIAILSPYGRASRLDWWIITTAGGVVAQLAFVAALISRFQEPGPDWVVFTLAVLAGLAGLWATIAVTARRFRDRGDSPWMTLLLAVPVLGEIWVLIVCGFLPPADQPKRRLAVRKVVNGGAENHARQADASGGDKASG